MLCLSALALSICAGAPTRAAVNLVTNGSFETGFVRQNEFGATYKAGIGPVSWSSPSPHDYNVYFDPAIAATVEIIGHYTHKGQKLSPSFSGASPDGGYFIGLDGDPKASGPVQQMISGLVSGKSYDVSFYWAATQLQVDPGPTSNTLQVGFGQATQFTAVALVPTQGFSGWLSEHFRFTAGSDRQLLSFMAVGGPSGLPPFALLDGVSVTAVPEPSTWALALLGLGIAGVAMRRERTNKLAL